MDFKSIKNNTGRLGNFLVSQWTDTGKFYSQQKFCMP